jgi:hypothetical protein
VGQVDAELHNVSCRAVDEACAEAGAEGNGCFAVIRNDCIWRPPCRMGDSDEFARSDTDATEYTDTDRAVQPCRRGW